ncbi:MAG: molybdopterin-dependent oxidoreductase, partial [Rhodospirillaceae bacterium]|nr:molybdopterin-dependent oxidoreductase [Rhodospirillaceae bacterium]
TVAGRIAHTNAPDGEARLDLAQLQALPSRTIETTTPWTKGVQSFTGVAVAELLRHLGADGARLHATATNAYEVDFPVTDATNHDGIIAYLHNGAPLAADKGPLWIVFPYDSDPALLGDRFRNASIWNLATLTLH